MEQGIDVEQTKAFDVQGRETDSAFGLGLSL